ncbi:DUF3772 domain-containing protein [Advenella sp. S44]|uniref:DUF3772 domain-containing protein n=1 Tax=Advenella sp. S44 TaxID=1982755 RepID=UPI0013747973|nr:DUF3772 domain-containing protein [Advenella sp. S44]
MIFQLRSRTTFRPLPGLGWALVLLTLLAALCCAGPAWSQAKEAPPDVAQVLKQAQTQIEPIKKQLEAIAEAPLDDAALAAMREQALKTQSAVGGVAATLGPKLKDVQERLAELGPVDGATTEASNIREQRAELGKERGKLDSQIKLARLLGVEAEQAAEKLSKERRERYQAQLGERTASILSGAFWTDLAREWARDSDRTQPLANELSDLLQAMTPAWWIGVAIAISLLIGVRLTAEQFLLKAMTRFVAPGRLRRSLYALVVVVMSAVAYGLMAEMVRAGLSWKQSPTSTMNEMLTHMVLVSWFGGFVAGLGKALLAAHHPSWRLIPMRDDVALNLRWFPVVLATIISLGWFIQGVFSTVYASLALTVAFNCIISLITSIAMGVTMVRSRKRYATEAEAAQRSNQLTIPGWLNTVISLAGIALIVSQIALLLGYVALGTVIVQQLVWVFLVLLSAYLLAVLIDDICTVMLISIKRQSGQDEDSAFPAIRSQLLVLASGMGRLLVVLLALALLLAPFGGGPTEWLRNFSFIYSGISLGEVQIRPTAILIALAVLVLGFALVKMLQNWLTEQYLPTTRMDAGMRASAGALFGYAGYVLAGAMTLSALGIGLERVAWIASALSVGIGFGLQAIVQNFVSGLILLAERPVKVGDWVSLNGAEGDIRRINVRATEIQLWDRSTMIVPNSELITKVVRNVTHANPVGRVLIRLPLPVGTDPSRVRDIILAAYEANEDVLAEPRPDILLDSIEAAGLIFISTGYVNSPRMVARVRSALLFDILQQLHVSDIALAAPATMMLKEVAAPPQSKRHFEGGPD